MTLKSRMTVFKEVHYGFKRKKQKFQKKSFEVKTCVKQGDCLSPLLCNLAPEKAMKRVAEMETGL
ncbi:hypothetical protein PR048_026651 [Dryococelus australis]|uniref:Reverse transcriptase n=1 Tax=Dryococelus australis TaxID=614101 RepID=A0ABQ9GLZ4_9NEOP|nr:hypothetical protein PR048_026651 [Dryococelus australis]